MRIRWPGGLYGREMTGYIEDEMEVGTRAADFLDMENNWDRDWFADRGPRAAAAAQGAVVMESALTNALGVEWVRREAGPGAQPELEAG